MPCLSQIGQKKAVEQKRFRGIRVFEIDIRSDRELGRLHPGTGKPQFFDQYFKGVGDGVPIKRAFAKFFLIVALILDAQKFAFRLLDKVLLGMRPFSQVNEIARQRAHNSPSKARNAHRRRFHEFDTQLRGPFRLARAQYI
jgi:hypothetical protein